MRPALYHEINNFYTATVYEKGAEVVRMLKTLLGPEISARAWTSTSPATTARPRRSSSSCDASPMPPALDLEQFMRWYSQAGTPEVVAAGRYDPRAKTYRLEVRQNVPPTPGQP